MFAGNASDKPGEWSSPWRLTRLGKDTDRFLLTLGDERLIIRGEPNNGGIDVLNESGGIESPLDEFVSVEGCFVDGLPEGDWTMSGITPFGGYAGTLKYRNQLLADRPLEDSLDTARAMVNDVAAKTVFHHLLLHGLERLGTKLPCREAAIQFTEGAKCLSHAGELLRWPPVLGVDGLGAAPVAENEPAGGCFAAWPAGAQRQFRRSTVRILPGFQTIRRHRDTVLAGDNNASLARGLVKAVGWKTTGTLGHLCGSFGRKVVELPPFKALRPHRPTPGRCSNSRTRHTLL
jgi:hypothetical protein